MKFSIITCTWNSMPYLEQSISSVLAQDCKDIEYIFVDGGSTDGTLDLIARIPREIKIIHGVRGGIANAMNVGIRAATGDIIAHMHSDDYYLQNDVLNRVHAIFELEDCKWFFGRIMFNIEGQLVTESYKSPEYSYSALLKRNFVPHAATFVKKSVFEDMGYFDESFRLAMDYEMWLRIGNKFSPSVITEPLSAFRVHSKSATQANQLASLNEDFKARFMYSPIYRYPEFALRYLIRRNRLVSKLST